MPVFYVYILKCIDTKGKISYYTGSTEKLVERFHQHRTGEGAKYTHGRSLELIFFETHTTRSSAMQREYEIKRMSKKKKLALIDAFQARVKEANRPSLEKMGEYYVPDPPHFDLEFDVEYTTKGTLSKTEKDAESE